MFSIYSVIIITIGVVINSKYNIIVEKYNPTDIIRLDILCILFNTEIAVLILHYKEKIKKVELSYIPTTDRVNITEISDTQYAENLFGQIEEIMEVQQLYLKKDFNLQQLSTILQVKGSDILQVLRYKNFDNFTNYINTLRIKEVKELLNNTNLQKVTLMYIYTQAGFKNQSTFNRVFKQIEGTTPSEYILSLSNQAQIQAS